MEETTYQGSCLCGGVAYEIRKSGFKSNYHLGFERAYAVREYLVSRGVPPTSVYVASHGPDQVDKTGRCVNAYRRTLADDLRRLVVQ